MTPSEMRRRAWRSLQSAELITEEGNDPDTGGYLAGFAAELALKARFCAIKGLPTDNKARRDLKLNSHGLDHLLTLSDSAKVQRAALDSIDWASISEWNNEDRYEALGHVSIEQARLRIQQTRLLFRALVDHEIVEGLTRVEAELAAQGVLFNLFAWMQRADGTWKFTMASKWFDELDTRGERMARVHALAKLYLAPDLIAQLEGGGVECDGLDDPLPIAFYTVFSLIGNMNLKSSVVIGGGMPPMAGRRNTQVLALDNVHTDSGPIRRAYVIAVQPPGGQAPPPSALRPLSHT